jgi:hypothetical protein
MTQDNWLIQGSRLENMSNVHVCCCKTLFHGQTYIKRSKVNLVTKLVKPRLIFICSRCFLSFTFLHVLMKRFYSFIIFCAFPFVKRTAFSAMTKFLAYCSGASYSNYLKLTGPSFNHGKIIHHIK